jgi:ADP-heptose:LPS heptosyltransferase
MPAMRSNPRPLVVRCGAFGDMVLLTALLRILHARYGAPVDIVTSGAWSRPLLQDQPGVGELYVLRSRKTPYLLSLDQHRVVRQLRDRGIGPTWFCDGNDAARPLLRRAGISDDFVVYAKDHDLMPGEHATEQWRRLAQLSPVAAEACGGTESIDVSRIVPGCLLSVTDPQRADLDAWRARRGFADVPYLAVQIGNKRTMRRGFKRLAANSKHWPLERWTEVLRFLRQRHPDHAIVLLGTGPEFELNEMLLVQARVERACNVADELPIPRLVALLERASGLITVDSGPAHVAAAVGCPQVTLFGKARPALYRPWGVAGADTRVVTGMLEGQADMLGITVRQVTDAWSTLALRGLA